MAVNLGSAYGKISLDVKGFLFGINQAKAGASQLGSNMGGLQKVFAALVTSAVLVKTGKMLFDLGENALMASARVEELEVINEQLAKNAGISQESMKGETEEVRKMGIETAVSNQVVAEFMRNQLELGKASDLARVAQDAATISGKNSTEALYGILTGIVTLQPEVIRTNGIIINLIGAETAYAKSVGKTIQELTTAEKQQIALNEVLKAGVSVAGAYEASMTKASKILRSFPRYINDILVNLGEPFQGSFDKGVKAVGEFLKKLGEMTAEGGKLRPMLDKLAVSVDIFVDKFIVFLENFDAEKFADGLMKVLDGLGKFFQFIIDNWPLISIILIALAARLAAKQFNPFNDGIGGVIGTLFKFIGVIVFVVKLLMWLGISTGTVGSAFVTLGGIIGTVLNPIPFIIGAIASAFLPILVVIASLILFAGIFALAWATDFLFIRSAAQMMVKVVTALWKAFMAFLKGDTEGALEYVKEAFQAFGDHVNMVFEKVFGIKDAWKNFLEWLRTAVGNVRTYISDVFTKTNWSQVGRFITFGIANGMLLGIPALILAASKAGEAALAAIKQKLIIRSPSGAFEKLGMLSAQGYQLGLARAMNPEDIARTMARPVNQMSNQQQNITMQFASGLNIQQVRGMISENNDQILNTIIGALGGA